MDEVHAKLVEDATHRLEKLNSKRDLEKEFRYQLLGFELEEVEQRARSHEVRGISRYALRNHDKDPTVAESLAMEDLLAAKAIRPLNNEATGILATLESGAASKPQQGKLADKSATEKEGSSYAALVGKDPVSRSSETTPEKRNELAPPPTVPKYSAQRNADLQAGKQPAQAQKGSAVLDAAKGEVRKAKTTAIKESEAVGRDGRAEPAVKVVAAKLDTSLGGADDTALSINVERLEALSLITVTPAKDVKVDSAEGLLRFWLGERFWDVSIDGVATEVKRRRGRLEVKVEKAHCES